MMQSTFCCICFFQSFRGKLVFLASTFQLQKVSDHATLVQIAGQNITHHLTSYLSDNMSHRTQTTNQDENRLTSVSTQRLREPLVNLGTMTDDNPDDTSVLATGNNKFSKVSKRLSPAYNLDANIPYLSSTFTHHYTYKMSKKPRIESANLDNNAHGKMANMHYVNLICILPLDSFN